MRQRLGAITVRLRHVDGSLNWWCVATPATHHSYSSTLTYRR